MTKLLTEAFERASSLSEDLQDQLAQEFLEEIAWEARWDETLRGSQDKLDRLAEKAEQDYRAGKTKEMGFDEL
jgi:ribosome biogenesis GTPase A